MITERDRPAETPPPVARDALADRLRATLPVARANTIERLIQTVQVRSVAPGRQIYRQGDPVPLTLILTGYGAARRTTVNGRSC